MTDTKSEYEKCEEIEKSKIDICYFVKNIMHYNLRPYEEILLQKIIEARKAGKELVFINGGRLLYRKKLLHNILQEYIKNYLGESNDLDKTKNEYVKIKTRIKVKPDKPEYWTIIDDFPLHGDFDPEYK